jgi:hypothetical protein
MDSSSTPHPAIFVPKATYGKYGLYDASYKIVADWDYFLGLYLKEAVFSPVDEVLTVFRASGISSQASKKHYKENSRVYLKYFGARDAWKKIAKMYFRYCVRRFLQFLRLYGLYSAHRDKSMSEVIFSCEYDGGSPSWWERLRNRGASDY